eukprot:g5835.t1
MSASLLPTLVLETKSDVEDNSTFFHSKVVKKKKNKKVKRRASRSAPQMGTNGFTLPRSTGKASDNEFRNQSVVKTKRRRKKVSRRRVKIFSSQRSAQLVLRRVCKNLSYRLHGRLPKLSDYNGVHRLIVVVPKEKSLLRQLIFLSTISNEIIQKSKSKHRAFQWQIARFPGARIVCDKIPFAARMAVAARLIPELIGEFWPESWSLPRDLNSLKLTLREEQSQETNEGNRQGDEKMLIVKPDHGMQGKGIFLCSASQVLSGRLNKLGSNIEDTNTWVAQRYISNPHLLEGKKYDLRLYVLVVSLDPLLVFLCRDGLVRLCTDDYVAPDKNLSNVTMHLSNYSLNKLSENYIHSVDDETGGKGHKRALSAVLESFAENGVTDVKALWQKLCGVVSLTVQSMRPSLVESVHGASQSVLNEIAAKAFYDDDRSNEITQHLSNLHAYGRCFHIFGFDIMLDNNMQPWLLEVNANPSLNIIAPQKMSLRDNDDDNNVGDDSNLDNFESDISPIDEAVKVKVVTGALEIALSTYSSSLEGKQKSYLSPRMSQHYIPVGTSNEEQHPGLLALHRLQVLCTELLSAKGGVTSYRFRHFVRQCGLITLEFTLRDVDALYATMKSVARLRGESNSVVKKGLKFRPIELAELIQVVAAKAKPHLTPLLALTSLLDNYDLSKREAVASKEAIERNRARKIKRALRKAKLIAKKERAAKRKSKKREIQKLERLKQKERIDNAKRDAIRARRRKVESMTERQRYNYLMERCIRSKDGAVTLPKEFIDFQEGFAKFMKRESFIRGSAFNGQVYVEPTDGTSEESSSEDYSDFDDSEIYLNSLNGGLEDLELDILQTIQAVENDLANSK